MLVTIRAHKTSEVPVPQKHPPTTAILNARNVIYGSIQLNPHVFVEPFNGNVFHLASNLNDWKSPLAKSLEERFWKIKRHKGQQTFLFLRWNNFILMTKDNIRLVYQLPTETSFSTGFSLTGLQLVLEATGCTIVVLDLSVTGSWNLRCASHVLCAVPV